MYEYILCPSCGAAIGDVYRVYRAMVTQHITAAQKKQQYKGTPAFYMVTHNPDEIDSLDDVFNMLHIPMTCCRGHLTASVSFHDHFNSK